MTHQRRKKNCWKVLIETLWNVKCVGLWTLLDDCRVLIETLWNVKATEIVSEAELSPGFNRNIVECKVPNAPQFN